MKLIDRILGRENMLRALKAVKRNKGAAGIDKVTVEEFDEYFRQHWTEFGLVPSYRCLNTLAICHYK